MPHVAEVVATSIGIPVARRHIVLGTDPTSPDCCDTDHSLVAWTMRILVMLVSVAAASPASAQGPPDTWEFGLGPHVTRQDSTTHLGGGLTIARRYRTLAAVFEGSGTRRLGHNDWRLIGGPRVVLGIAGRSSFFAQALAGTLIRQRDADWAVLPGLGVEVQYAGSRAVRLQVDVPLERTESHTGRGIRASAWLTFR